MFFKRRLQIGELKISKAPVVIRLINVHESQRFAVMKLIHQQLQNSKWIREEDNCFHVNYWFAGINHDNLAEQLLEELKQGKISKSVIFLSRYLGCEIELIQEVLHLAKTHHNYVFILESEDTVELGDFTFDFIGIDIPKHDIRNNSALQFAYQMDESIA